MLHPQRLLVLRAVIEAGSITAAARNLSYSPATISQHMAALARETGLVLLEREGRGVLPTDAARHLAGQAQAVLDDLDRLDRVVADLRGGGAQPLAIACFTSAAEMWMPAVVRAVREVRPGTTVEISLNEPVDGRGRRRPDLDVRTEPVTGAAVHLDAYARHELTVEPLVAVLPTAHPLADSPSIALRELRDEPWVDHDIYDSPIGRIVRSACTAAGFTPRHAARLDDHRAALRLVAAGIGITVLPRLAVADLADGLVARTLLDPVVERRIVVHAGRDRRRRSVIDIALQALQDVAGDSAAQGSYAATGARPDPDRTGPAEQP